MNSQKIVEEINEPRKGRKSSSGESNEEAEKEVNVPDYVDKAGIRWHFLCHAKEEELAQFVQQNGLVPGNENGKRRKFGCSRPECHFRAVFLKANSGIYTRGEHWHEQLDGKKRKNGNIDKTETSKVDQKGGVLRLVCHFETDEEFDKYRRENWLMKSGTSNNDRIHLSCRRGNQNRSKLSTNCRVYGVYVKHSRSFYLNDEQHNHPMGKEHRHNDQFSRFLSQNMNYEKADYVDQRGQLWHFLRQINNLEELETFAKKQMLYLNSNGTAKLFYFECKYAHPATIRRLPFPPPYCKMRAIFIKATSSFYVRREHSNHPPFKIKSSSWSRNSKLYKELADLFGAENVKKNVEIRQENTKQNMQMPKEEADSAGEDGEVRIVKHLQRDYKCLGRMKPEEGGEEGQSGANCRPVHTIQLGEEEDLEEGTSQGTRRRGTFYRYTQRELQGPIKKEEPEEEEAEPAEDAPLPVPQPQLPANIAWLQQFKVVRPAKMLLRERKKRINYGE